jgi:endonuclease/exonuclease/phosphatase (EEP) superfamily protein YafD
MGLCVNLPPGEAAAHDPARIRLITFNLGPSRDPAAFIELMARERPDVVALQEFGADNPLMALAEQGWHVWRGRGVCVMSRFPIRDAEAFPDRNGWRDFAGRCELDTPGGTVHLFNVHLETPRHEIEAFLDDGLAAESGMRAGLAERWEQSAVVSRAAADTGDGATVVAGDFNLVPHSAILRSHWRGYADAFPAAGLGFGFTKLTRWWGVRIDRVLTGPAMRPVACRVGPDVGSDHRPVIADLVWIRGGVAARP